MRNRIIGFGIIGIIGLFLVFNIYGEPPKTTPPSSSQPAPTKTPSTSPAPIDNQPLTRGTFVQLTKNHSPAVVNVVIMREYGAFGTKAKAGHGSGFIIDNKKGIILTNSHVVQGAKALMVNLNDKRSFKVKVLGTDPTYDVAVVQMENPPADLKQVTLGNSDKLQIGDFVVAMGFPGDMGYVVTAGNVIALGKEAVTNSLQFKNIEYRGAYIMIDAIINPGNSGGPLFNLNGEVVGINTVGVRERGAMTAYGGSIPINTAIDIKDRIIKDGRIVRAYFGLSGSDIDEELAMSYNQSFEEFIKDLGLKSPKGIFMREGVEGSPAESLNFKEGDILIEFADKKVDSLSDFRTIILKSKPEQEVKLKYIRKGKEETASVKLAEMGSGEPEKEEPTKNDDE